MMRSSLVLAVLAACGSSHGSSPGDAAGLGGDGASDGVNDGAMHDGGAGAVTLPPSDGKFDYQLGGPYAPPAGVAIVSRDRSATPAAGLYNICYINGFQIQTDETSFWMTSHPDLILQDSQGHPVVDTAWNEMLIDVSTPAKRTAVAAIVAGWIDACQAAGFDAIEIDNLDSYSRSQGLLVADDNVAAMGLFSAAAHHDGLAIAQKNSTELVPRRVEMATDFVTAEECNRYSECATYFSSYGDHVLMVEYRQSDFTAGCTAYPGTSLVLRDLDLVPAGSSGYVFQLCP